VVSVTTDPSQWRQLKQSLSADTFLPVQQALLQFHNTLLKPLGLGYESHIRSWIGAMATLVVLPMPKTHSFPSMGGVDGQTGDIVLILPIIHRQQAEETFRRTLMEPGGWTTHRYNGILVYDPLDRVPQPENRGRLPSYSLASLWVGQNHFLVLANHSSLIHQVIDTQLGVTSLHSRPAYQQAIGQLNHSYPEPFAQVYLNIPALALILAREMGLYPPGERINLPQTEGLLLGLNLMPDGVGIKGLSWLKQPQKDWSPGNSTVGTIATRLPANTLFMFRGSNFTRLWQLYVNSRIFRLLGWLEPRKIHQTIETFLGMSLEENLFPWLQDEFCLAIVPNSQIGKGSPESSHFSSPFSASLVLMAKVRSRTIAEQVLHRVDHQMNQRYKLRLSIEEQPNGTVTRWFSPSGEVRATRSWLDDTTAVLSVGAPISLINLYEKTDQTQPGLHQNWLQDREPSHISLFIDCHQLLFGDAVPFMKLPPKHEGFWSSIQSIEGRVTIANPTHTIYEGLVRLTKNNGIQAPS